MKGRDNSLWAQGSRCVLSEFADLHYKVSRLYDHADEGGVLWNDSGIGIRWPIANPIISDRDVAYPALRQLDRESLPDLAGALKSNTRYACNDEKLD
jgi:hypothetical protein